MAGNNRRAGIIYLKINGIQYDAKGDYSYGLGGVTRASIIGADGVHGYSETPVPAFIEGAVTDRRDLDLNGLVTVDDATVTLELNNGKVIVLSEAYYVGETNVTTNEAEIRVRFESARPAQEIS
jgi:hypothetical protein